MKKKDVPQDNEGLLQDKFREPCYAVDEDGNYVTVPSTGWAPKNAALKQAWEEVNEKVDAARQEVLGGKRSMLAWYMEKNIMTIKLLSQYTGIPRRKIRKHLKPSILVELPHKTLQAYADVFNITIEELTDTKVLEEAE